MAVLTGLAPSSDRLAFTASSAMSPRRAIQPKVRVALRVGSGLFALATLAWSVAPAAAQNTLLHGAVGTTYVTTMQQSWSNVPIASLQDMKAHDAVGNDGIANGSLSIPNGRMKLSTHACSGGGPGFGGQANGSADASITLDYVISSATLPAGAPVSVEVNWALTSRVVAVGMDMVGSNTNATSSAAMHLALAPNYNVLVNRSGGVSRVTNTSGNQKIISGNTNAESDTAHYTFPMQVGQIIRVTIDCTVGENSSSESGTTDADAQLSAVWGLTSLDPAATVVLVSDLNQPAPPAELAIPDSALAGLPPRPAYLLPCFQFASQPASVSTCGPDSASFTVGAQGFGPFSYQWRKNGVPIDLQTNPTSQSSTLFIPNVVAGDAGTYDVVVYNACGNLVSDPASLEECTVSAPGTTPPNATRLNPARPAPFRASTTLSFELARAGAVKLDLFDLRGAHIRTLASGWYAAGHSEVVWRGDDESGRQMPAGVYLARFQAGGFSGTQRLVRVHY
ncbi:MAG: FlgD immunoglobulin-like domain containing protein [Candidatus Eisenbacteria bacterium]